MARPVLTMDTGPVRALRAAPVVNQVTESTMPHPPRALVDAPKRTVAAPNRTAGELFGKSINLSGRRRFTSQRVVLYALLASQGREGALATASPAHVVPSSSAGGQVGFGNAKAMDGRFSIGMRTTRVHANRGMRRAC